LPARTAAGDEDERLLPALLQRGIPLDADEQLPPPLGLAVLQKQRPEQPNTALQPERRRDGREKRRKLRALLPEEARQHPILEQVVCEPHHAKVVARDDPIRFEAMERRCVVRAISALLAQDVGGEID